MAITTHTLTGKPLKNQDSREFMFASHSSEVLLPIFAETLEVLVMFTENVSFIAVERD